MKTLIHCSAAAALALSSLLSLPSVQAKSLLGDRYLAIGYQYIEIEDVDGWALGLGVNFPVVDDNAAWGLDISAAGAYGEISEADVEDLTASVSFFSKNIDAANLFARATLSHEHFSLFGIDEDTLTYGGQLGAEFELGDNISLTPFYHYIYIDEYNQGEDVFGIDFAYWLTEESNFSLGYQTYSENGVRFDAISFAYRMGF